MYWDCRHYWPGCDEFGPDRFGELSVSYIVSAIEHGKRLHYRDLHHQSVVPSKFMQFFVSSKGGDLPISQAMPWLKLAFPSELILPPEGIAAVREMTSRRLYPRWINKALPMDQMDGLPAAKEVPDPLVYSCDQFIGFAPKVINDQWIYFPIAAFDIPEGHKDPLVLYDEKSNPIAEIIVPKTGFGHFLDEQFVVKQWFAGVPCG